MILKKKHYKVKDYICLQILITPLNTLILIGLKIINALLPTVQVLATAAFIDSAGKVAVLNSQKINAELLTGIYFKMGIIVAVLGLAWLLQLLISLISARIDLEMRLHIQPLVIQKRNRLSYWLMENNEMWAIISRVGENTSDQFRKGFDNLLQILEYTIKISGLLYVIVIHEWWVAIVILIMGVPLYWLAVQSGHLDYDSYEEAQIPKRKSLYLKEVLISRSAAEERTVFGYADYFNEKWAHYYETARKIEYKADRRNFLKMNIASMAALFLALLIALILLGALQRGNLTSGLYISLVIASLNLVQQLSWKLSKVIQNFVKNKRYLYDFSCFMNLEETKDALSMPEVNLPFITFESIEFRNVTFSYPGSKDKVLDGLNMKLESNKQYAFVGTNGAGKTTITKLLTGLYDQYEGDILINDISLKIFSQGQIKAIFSQVFQDYSKYQISLRDNILLGNVHNFNEVADFVDVKALLRQVDLNDFVDSLPNKDETHLGKLFIGGIDLSGGQWQRLAIARALASTAPIIILDEPTASLDPISERQLYQQFKAICKNRSTLLITHRLGAARIADEILVLKSGRIIEKGSHEMLLYQKGVYAEMFEAQRRWYDESPA